MPHGKPLGHYHFGQPLLLENVGHTGEQFRVAQRQLTIAKLGSNGLGQIEKANVVGDRAAFLAQPTGHLGLGQAQLIHQCAVALGTLDGV